MWELLSFLAVAFAIGCVVGALLQATRAEYRATRVYNLMSELNECRADLEGNRIVVDELSEQCVALKSSNSALQLSNEALRAQSDLAKRAYDASARELVELRASRATAQADLTLAATELLTYRALAKYVAAVADPESTVCHLNVAHQSVIDGMDAVCAAKRRAAERTAEMADAWRDNEPAAEPPAGTVMTQNQAGQFKPLQDGDPAAVLLPDIDIFGQWRTPETRDAAFLKRQPETDAELGA